MSTESSPPTARSSSANVVLFPLLGLLAVGNFIFAFLWLYPSAAGPGAERGGRRIEAVVGERVVRLDEGTSGPAMIYEASLPSEAFDKLSGQIAGVAKSIRGELAKQFFESEAGKAAKPACAITFPTRKGTETLEAYVLDVRRQLCYCRFGSTKEPIAIKAPDFQKVTSQIAQEVGNVAGSLPLPYYVPIEGPLAAKLAKLETPLHVTTVSVNPVNYVQDVLNPKSPVMANSIQFAMPDPMTILAMFQLSEELAMARGLAETMARVCPKVVAKHLDFATQSAAVRDFARLVKRPPDDIADSLVLQYGDRVRVIRSSDLVAREEAAVGMAPAAPRFVGESVVAKALDDLLSERGLIYFAEGFGERHTGDATAVGYRQIGEQIAASGFRVTSLDLTAAKAIPADCSILVIPGPKNAYPAPVTEAIARYVQGGGRLALFLDPPNGANPLAELLKGYGISVPDMKGVITLNMPGVSPGVVPAELNRRVDFTRDWPREPILLFTAVELDVKPAAPGAPFEVVRLASVPTQEGEGGGQGPCVMAAVRAKGPAKGPKIFVCSDADAFSNQIVRRVASNAPFLTAVLNWLGQ